jgi:Tfp pilus assembly protein FimT
VLAIIAVLAIPNIRQISASYKLDASGHSVSSLLQQARMQAVQTNLPVYVNSSNGSVNMAFITNDPNNTTYTAGSPDVALSSAVSFQPPPPTNGFHAQLDTYLNGGTPQFGSIGFNARGLPCTGTSNVCTAIPGGFEWFLKSNIGWEAITVTAAGRIKTWRLSSQSGGTYSWQ